MQEGREIGANKVLRERRENREPWGNGALEQLKAANGRAGQPILGSPRGVCLVLDGNHG